MSLKHISLRWQLYHLYIVLPTIALTGLSTIASDFHFIFLYVLAPYNYVLVTPINRKKVYGPCKFLTFCIDFD